MTKQELSEMLHATGCPVNEGISDLDNGKKFPRSGRAISLNA